jgi:hypothetical protein
MQLMQRTCPVKRSRAQLHATSCCCTTSALHRPPSRPLPPARQVNTFMQNDNNLARAIIDQCDVVDEKWVAAVLIYAARHMKPKRIAVGGAC